jgi:hypothetical protein
MGFMYQPEDVEVSSSNGHARLDQDLLDQLVGYKELARTSAPFSAVDRRLRSLAYRRDADRTGRMAWQAGRPGRVGPARDHGKHAAAARSRGPGRGLQLAGVSEGNNWVLTEEGAGV